MNIGENSVLYQEKDLSIEDIAEKHRLETNPFEKNRLAGVYNLRVNLRDHPDDPFYYLRDSYEESGEE